MNTEYIDISLDCLNKFGVKIINNSEYSIDRKVKSARI